MTVETRWQIANPAAAMGVPDKEVFFIGEQPHDAKVSCGCLFAVLAKFRGKINLPDKIIVYVNALDTMAAGFIGSMDNDFLHKLPQKCRGQFSWLGVFLYDFQKTLDIDSLGLGGGYYLSQFLCGLLQIRLLLFIALGQLSKPLYA